VKKNLKNPPPKILRKSKKKTKDNIRRK